MSTNSSYTQILYSPVGKTALMSGSATTRAYFPLPGGATLFETGSSVGNRFFWHKDWLGSVRIESNMGSRAPTHDRAFAPYGEAYDNFGQTDPVTFTGDTNDTAPDLYDTPNRELHPTQGRWISPDPAGLSAVDMSNPQSWNRYAYVMSNPLSNVDPTGLACWFVNAGDCASDQAISGRLDNCTMDGVDTPCNVVLAMLHANGALSALQVLLVFLMSMDCFSNNNRLATTDGLGFGYQ